MSSRPSVVVLDDGELDRISHLLAELGAEFVLLRGNEIDTRFRLPRDLLITTATRAVWISELDDVPRWSGAPLWITIQGVGFPPRTASTFHALRDCSASFSTKRVSRNSTPRS